MLKKFYITTPLYYVNASPHIGHSYTNVAADTLARYMRAAIGEENVWFLTGTDEHGQKIQRAADAQKMTPRDFTDSMAGMFKGLWKDLDISYNDFIRTTEERHIRVVRRALDILYKKGDIYQAQYEGLYCTPCESFWTEKQAEGRLCPDCRRPVETITETNFFFKLSSYQDWLVKHIESNPDFVKPDYRRNEVLSFLNMNTLNDLCISRPKERLSWGIPLPFSPDHVTYVWFDALLNYISAVGDFDESGVYRSRWWPADLQLMGKDILRQHAVYWPIMLRSLGIEPPRHIFAHGWWLVGDGKMSKSKGNVVSPVDMASRFGIDAYRYFLLRDVPFGLDGNFSEESVIKRINGDLANDLGNLLYRTLTMIEKYFGGSIPRVALPDNAQAQAIDVKLRELEAVVAGIIGEGEPAFSAALEAIWVPIGMANKYIEDTKPWNLAKENRIEELKAFIGLLAEVLRKVAVVIAPFMPRTAESMRAQIGGDTINKGAPLFPRIEIK
jgi:methionyl-tRNA synthetase